VIEIEFGETHKNGCECCGATQYNRTRFVHRDGDAHAVYYASHTDGHIADGITVALSVGNWWEDDALEERFAFCLVLWSNDDEFGVTVQDWESHMWPGADLLGQRLNRDQALAHPFIKEAFHITDHIFAEDKALTTFLDQEKPDNR